MTQTTTIEGGEESYWANLNLAIHGDRFVLDGVKTQNG